MFLGGVDQKVKYHLRVITAWLWILTKLGPNGTMMKVWNGSEAIEYNSIAGPLNMRDQRPTI